jgi:hypothetical protein
MKGQEMLRRGAIVLAALVYGQIALAQTPDSSLEFLFSDDNKVPTFAKQEPPVAKKALIPDDAWLKAPATHLDLVLMNIQTDLNATDSRQMASESKEFFEPKEVSYARIGPAFRYQVRYPASTGRLFIALLVDDLGKPKMPMKRYCDYLLTSFRMQFPKDGAFYERLWSGRAFGTMLQDDSFDYEVVAQKLAASAVFLVRLNSVYKVGEKHGYFGFTCRQQEIGQIEYFKYSGMLSQ